MYDGIIDLFSDTATRPTPAMRRAMAEAVVGDDHKGEDPTVNWLQEKVADLLGKEDALYLPSATMGNEIAFKVHTNPGDEIIMERTSHPVHFEGGAPAFLSGAMIYSVEGRRGIFEPERIDEAVRPNDIHFPRSKLVSVENTHNLGGGAIWPLEKLQAACRRARHYQLGLHLDGARLLNAVVATGISARDYAAPFDSVCLCLSKGLGAPVGAVLAGSEAFISEAKWQRLRLGGAMRQAGIIAAGGVYALDHHVPRLAEDHQHAKILAGGLAEIPGIALNVDEVETNIVFFDVSGLGLTAAEVVQRLLQCGVRMGALGRTRVRAVTHLDVTRSDIDRAVAVARETLGKGNRG
ncbi:MAG: low specificity L-threonine aldolase [Deinococcus sp.]|nr:low specificity L-threonine aldolase [Deinococcus sp.]